MTDDTAPRTREDLAPYHDPGTATADQLARYELVFSLASSGGMTGGGNVQEAIAWTVAGFNTAFLLRELAKADPEAADEAARAVLRFGDLDAQVAHELTCEWLAGYGIDPREVVAAGHRERAERAEARRRQAAIAEHPDVVDVETGAAQSWAVEAERAAIVAWLRSKSAGARHFDYDQFEAAADAIEAGEHRG